MTHKREWDKFVRSKERYRIHSYYQSNKLELFGIFLDSGCCWDTTCLAVERKQSQTNEAKRGWIAKRGKDIKIEYGEEKGLQIIASRTSAGLYYESEDFPNDADDTCPFTSEILNIKMPCEAHILNGVLVHFDIKVIKVLCFPKCAVCGVYPKHICGLF